MRFYIVDVFGDEKYSGNQLAVVRLEENISEDRMQQIANEFHFSETAFILSSTPAGNEFDVKIFTPVNEVPFAGHPTLGTAFIIRNELLDGKADEIVLNLKVGKIPVKFHQTGLLWMKQIEPGFGISHQAVDIAKIINLNENDIDTNFPILNVSTGIEFTIIPLKNLAAIRRASTNIEKYKEYFGDKDATPLFLFCPETYDRQNNLNCRMFADIFGIPEDPATGSGNGCLAGYLIKNKYFNESKMNIRVEQGFEIGRKSILHLNAFTEDGKINIYIGGKVIKIAEGMML